MGDMTYEYAAILEFNDIAGLKAYLGDPRHHQLGRVFWEFCERTIVSEVQLVDPTDTGAADKLVS